MPLTNNTNGNYIPRQLKLPLDIEKIIDFSDPVYSFCKCQYKNDQKMENKNVQFPNVYSSVCASI